MAEASRTARGMLLAGTLEKRSQWKKKWNHRFCVVWRGHIDYFLHAPKHMEEVYEAEDTRRGTILLCSEGLAVSEPGRPFCINVSGELLSCINEEEQQRWLNVISMAAKSWACGPGPGPLSALLALPASADVADDLLPQAEELSLQLLPSEEPPRRLGWQEKTSVLLTGKHSAPTLLVLDRSGTTAAAFCRLDFHGVPTGEAAFPLMTAGGSPTKLRLDAQILSSEMMGESTKPGSSIIGEGVSLTCLLGVLALALSCAVLGKANACSFVTVLAMVFVLLEIRIVGSPKVHPHEESQKEITFMVERLTAGIEATVPHSLGICSEAQISPSAPLDHLEFRPTLVSPRWLGLWKLDKARSDKYEPVFADMSVNFLIRKAADAKVSYLDISKSDTHLTILVKSLVNVEDSIPLDGSWVSKPVPTGSKMRGMCRLCLTKCTDSELEMYTEFPEGWGVLRDTLAVADDGQSFSRRIARSDTLAITRYFTLESRGS